MVVEIEVAVVLVRVVSLSLVTKVSCSPAGLVELLWLVKVEWEVEITPL